MRTSIAAAVFLTVGLAGTAQADILFNRSR